MKSEARGRANWPLCLVSFDAVFRENQAKRAVCPTLTEEHTHAKKDSMDSVTGRGGIGQRHSNHFRARARRRESGTDRPAKRDRERTAVGRDRRAQADGTDARRQAHGDRRLSSERYVEEIPYGFRPDPL